MRRGLDPEDEAPLVHIDDHRARILAGVEQIGARKVALADALGCVLARDVIARSDVPPFVSSAMDGYAVRSSDIASATADDPVPLHIAGEVAIGGPSAVVVGDGEAVVVSTGCIVPFGADAVVPVELTVPDGAEVRVLRAMPSGKHVRPAGEDVRRGETVIAAGRRLRPPDVGAIAVCGFGEIEAIPRARVAVVSTGDELVRPPLELREGQIYDSNTFVLAACVREAGADPVDGGPVPDDPGRLVEALDRIAADVDAFVCSGGVSMGEHDPVKRAFENGGDITFASVAMQPGRPQAFGHWKGKPFFGLPGNPISAYVSFEVFVRPALAKMMGRSDDRPAVDAILDGELDAPRSRTRFARVRVRKDREGYVATPEGSHQSNLLVTFARADGLVEIPAGTSISRGESCRVRLIGGAG